jgi:2-polyprenyl-3-methyl-5-hydroxy-6-metoxy-1,4-benzoquinol methylase
MIGDVDERMSPAESYQVLDVGCFNGYISYLFQRMGFQVTGADFFELDERRELFDANGIGFVRANFNSLDPFPDVNDGSFDVVVLAQVVEHILNHPLGFVAELARLTRPGGLLLVTTPQPASLMNMSRMLFGKWAIWGTEDFIRLPKISSGEVISHAEIHYREYVAHELCAMIEKAGYEILKHQYMGFGVTISQPSWKRLVKSNPITQWLMTKRLFASNQYVLARKPGA